MFNKLPIRTRLILTLIGSFAALIVIASAAFWTVTSLNEDQHEQDNLRNVTFIIQLEERALETANKELGDWSEMFQWMDRRDPKFIEAQVAGRAGRDLDVQMVLVIDRQGRAIYSWGDFPEYRGNLSSLPMVRESLHGNKLSGLTLTSRGPMIVSMVPIEDSTHHQPQKGAIALGRLIDNDLAAVLKRASGLDITVFAADQPVASSLKQAGPLMPEETTALYKSGKSLLENRGSRSLIIGPLPDINKPGSFAGAVAVVRERRSLIFATAAILGFLILIFALVFFIGWNFSAGLVDRILALQQVVLALERGEHPRPVPVKSRDELGQLVETLNKMIGELDETHSRAQENTERLELEIKERSELFDNSPISLWEEDYTELDKYFQALKASGVYDFAAYFDQHPEEVAKCAALVRVIDVNKATLAFYGARDKAELTENLAKTFSRESYDFFRLELAALAQGRTEFSGETVNLTLAGEPKQVLLRLAVIPNKLRALISIVDITGIRHAEENLRARMKEMKELADTAVGRELKMESLEREIGLLRQQLEERLKGRGKEG